MDKLIGTVFNVRRHNATKTTDVGDFITLDEAKQGMVNHFQNTPKRGNFQYIINEEELHDINGTVMRMFCINISGRGKHNFYKSYSRAELSAIADGT